MRRRGTRKLPPVRTWTERIDGTMVAAMAMCQETRPHKHVDWSDPYRPKTVRRRALYGIDTWVMVERKPNEYASSFLDRAQRTATEELVLLCPRGPYSLKFMGICDDIDPAAC